MTHHQSTVFSVDVLLICALKDEYDQVLEVIDGIQNQGWHEYSLASGWIVADASFTTKTGGSLRIRATHASHMGREQAQAIASRLIGEQPARCIAMSGICAGRRGKVALGDVIFAERLYSYDAGKLTIEDGKKKFQGDPIQYNPSPVLVQRMQHSPLPKPSTPWLSSRPILPLEHQENWVLLRVLAGEDPSQDVDLNLACPNWSDVLNRLWQRKWLEEPLTLTADGRQHAEKLALLHRGINPAPPNFKIHVAPMATGAAVSEEGSIFPHLANSMRKVLGIEMEASALGALGAVHDIPVMVVKGVSDYGDSFKDDRYRMFAARAAAECLIALLRNAADLLKIEVLQEEVSVTTNQSCLILSDAQPLTEGGRINSASISEIISNVDFCRNFPLEPVPKLPREQLFEVIQKTLISHRVVMLEGEPLSGKTECLADFMRRSPNTCIGVFLNPDLGVFQSPGYFRLVIAEQISWIVDGTRLSDDVVPEERYQQLLYKLQRHAKNIRITWLIDGLSSGKTNKCSDVSELIELIPFGMREFDFVVAGERDLTALINLHDQKPKSVLLFPVAREEATSYFSDMELEDSDVQEIRQFSAGVIGRMQKFREFLRAGISFDSLLQETNPSLESLFEFEWKLIPQTEDMWRILAYVVFSNKPVTVTEFTRYLEVEVDEVKAMLANCRILTVSVDTHTVSIESRAQRQFVKNRLGCLEKQVRSYIIKDLLETPTSKDAITYLPSQFMDAGRHDELLKHLDPNHFLSVLKTEHSLNSIRKHAELGIDAARALNNSPAELSLSLIRSMATGITFSIGSDSHIEALVKLGSSESALELASIAPTTEERLHLLTIAANALHKNNQPIPADLKNEIRLLQQDIHFENLGDLGVDIACNLLPVDFDVASEIINSVLDGARKRIESKNNTLAENRQEFGVSDCGDTSSPTGKRNLDHIPQNQARKFADAIVATVEKFSYERIVAFVKGIAPSNKIMVLARWLGQNREHIDACKIADQALDVVLSEASRSPRLQDLREIAEILPSIKNSHQRESLARRLNAQIGLLAHQGTSEEFCRLQLLLYRVRFPNEPSEVELSLIELFGEIEVIKEISVRTTCWAWMLFQLTQFENADKLEKDTSLISEVEAKLSQTINCLLLCTANHYLASKAAISALAQTNSDGALELVERLNTEDSRDKGYNELIRRLLNSNIDEKSLNVLKKAVESIVDDNIRTKAVLGVLRFLSRKAETQQSISFFPILGNLWRLIRVSSGKLQALTFAFRLQMLEQGDAVDIEKMTQMLRSLWEQVLSDSVRVELGYWIASELAITNPTLAQDWITRSIDFAKQRHIPSDSVLNALLTTVSLASRVFVYVDDTTDESYRRISSLIESIPSCELQLQLWTTLGIRMHYAEKSQVAKRIANGPVDQILNSSYPDNDLVFESMASNAAPLLYLVHPATATQIINRITSEHYRDLARSNICSVLMTHSPVGEPFEKPDDHTYSLEQGTVADVLTILKDIKLDSAILNIVEDICASIGSEANKAKITRNAAADDLNTLTRIVEISLPDSRNIKHKGYLIACRAYILKARCSIPKASIQKEEWTTLYSDARDIDNIADKVVVTAIVGSCAVLAKTRSSISNWIEDIRQDLAAIPSDQDRVDRYVWVASLVKSADRSACRNLLSDAMKQIVQLPETDDMVSRQRRILDMANAMDPKLANQLIDLNDGDDARQNLLKKEKIKYANCIALGKNPGTEEVSQMTDQELADICGNNLGQLLAGRIRVRAIEDFDALQKRASTMPINTASNIWHLIVESSLRKRSTDKNNNFASNLFNSTCKSSEIVCGLIGQFFSGEQRNRILDIGIVRYGDRELFLRRLRDWAMPFDNEVIRISDPYFGPEDLELVKAIFFNAPNVKFRILTSREQIRKKKLHDVAEAFEEAWQQISDETMPEIELSVVGIGNDGKHPIHDRWIVCEKSGLRLGTSAHSMGHVRTSEVSEIDSPDLLSNICEEVDLYMDRAPREIAGERLYFAKYTL